VNTLPVSERQLQDAILELAHLLGWRSYHTFDSRHSAAGFPDLVLVRGGRLIFAELKKGNEQLSREQAEWKRALERAGEVVYVWRPEDWRLGAVDAVLRASTQLVGTG
jgi:hypothetical protein